MLYYRDRLHFTVITFTTTHCHKETVFSSKAMKRRRKRAQTTRNIDAAFLLWRQIWGSEGLKSDAELTTILQD